MHAWPKPAGDQVQRTSERTPQSRHREAPQRRPAPRGGPRRRHGDDRRTGPGRPHHGGARPRGRHEQRPPRLLLPLQGRTAPADPGVERGPPRRRTQRPAVAARAPRRRPPRGVRRAVRPRRPRDPHWTLWLEVWNRSQNADADARARQAAIEGPGTATWSPCSPRASRGASCARSTPTATRPGCAPSWTGSACTWRWGYRAPAATRSSPTYGNTWRRPC